LALVRLSDQGLIFFSGTILMGDAAGLAACPAFAGMTMKS
jgi:hypothetical protein